ncbi:MAG: hypothetical protein SH818_01955 [Saprospiraceae bacterium]|nr:hypothetical protein [Saprospiraceae bacterium]
MKIPFFFKHYQLHKSLNASMDLLGFLNDHYCNGDFKDMDYEEDMKLPFKIPQNCVNNLPYYIHNLRELPKNDLRKPIQFNQIIIKDTWCRSSFYLNAIWQPPKSDPLTAA